MKKVLLGVVLGALGLYAYQRARVHDSSPQQIAGELSYAEPAAPPTPIAYKCDGRVYCSQMTSCEESMYFLHNCPGVKMDGEGDGIPCEKQWCGHQ